MFGLFSRKKQQVQNWHSPDVFLKELAKQDIPHQVRSNVSLYDVDFEKFVPVLNSDSNVWHRLELQYHPDVHQSKLDCLKYLAVTNSKSENQYIYEVYKNLTGTNVSVNIINLKLLFDFQNMIIKACKASLDNDTNIFIDLPILKIEEYLELIVFYEDFFKLSPNTEIIIELFRNYELHNKLGIFLKIFSKDNGVTTMDDTFQISRHTNTNAKVAVYKDAIPDTYAKKVNIYKKYGTGWQDFTINYKKLTIEE